MHAYANAEYTHTDIYICEYIYIYQYIYIHEQVAYILGMWKNMGDLQKKMLTMSLGISVCLICMYV